MTVPNPNSSPSYRMGWAREQWLRDPTIAVHGADGMIARLNREFGEAATPGALYSLLEECKQALARRGRTPRPMVASIGERAPRLAELRAAMAARPAPTPTPAPVPSPSPAPEPVPMPEPVPAPRLTYPTISGERVCDDEDLPRYWPTSAQRAWTREEHDAIVALVRAGVTPDAAGVRQLQLDLARKTASWRPKGGIMLHLRPLEFDLPGVKEICSTYMRLSKSATAARLARDQAEAALVAAGKFEELPDFITYATAIALVGARTRVGIAFQDANDDIIVTRRDEAVAVHRRVVAHFGKVAAERMPPRPDLDDAKLDEHVLEQVIAEPGISFKRCRGGDVQRLKASLDRLVAAGMVKRHMVKHGHVFGPDGWYPPSPAPAARRTKPKDARKAPAPEAAPAADPRAKAAARADVYRALAAKEITAEAAAELLLALTGAA